MLDKHDSGVSVAMCTFNGGRFLSAQLESIAAQSRCPEEVVVCDDGSSDQTREIVTDIARRSPFPIRFIANEIKLGTTRNFEQAISLCRGAIVLLADQDDVWYPHKVERMEYIFRQSSETVAAFSDANLIDDDSRAIGLRLWSTFGFDQAKQQQFANGHALGVLIRHPVVTGATMAFRRVLFDAMRPLPATDFHDRWLSFLLAARGRFEIIAEPLMAYRRHSQQQVGPGPLTLQAQMTLAQTRGARFYEQEIERFQHLSHKLAEAKESFPNAEYAQREIERKVSHFEHRVRLPRLKAARIPGVTREALNGNYWRYSGGWRSIVKDLGIR